MVALCHFLEICNFVMAKCRNDRTHPRWLKFRFDVSAGYYVNQYGGEWDNRRRKEKT